MYFLNLEVKELKSIETFQASGAAFYEILSN